MAPCGPFTNSLVGTFESDLWRKELERLQTEGAEVYQGAEARAAQHLFILSSHGSHCPSELLSNGTKLNQRLMEGFKTFICFTGKQRSLQWITEMKGWPTLNNQSLQCPQLLSCKHCEKNKTALGKVQNSHIDLLVIFWKLKVQIINMIHICCDLLHLKKTDSVLWANLSGFHQTYGYSGSLLLWSVQL